VTRNVARAAEQAYVPYVRLVRERGKIPQDAIVVDDADEAAKVCKTLSGNILLTTGTKELEPFLALPLCRLYPRVLPSSKNIATLEQAGIPHRNIIAMEGPFSLELNVAIIRQFHIEILVTKDGGTVGGFPEKAEAAKTTGTELIVLRSPEEKGSTYREVLNICREMMT
jgi:precorrin-6x reductase